MILIEHRIGGLELEIVRDGRKKLLADELYGLVNVVVTVLECQKGSDNDDDDGDVDGDVVAAVAGLIVGRWQG